MHLHSGAASGLRPCRCGTRAAPEASPHPPSKPHGGGGTDCESGLSFAGVLFLQFGEETRRVHITHEVSSLDTLHALIAHMFPQKLTMGMLKSPNTAILIKDEARNVFYELEDVRWAWPQGDGWASEYSSSWRSLHTPFPTRSGLNLSPNPLLPEPYRPAPHSLVIPAHTLLSKSSTPAGSCWLELT